MATPEKFRLDE